VRSHEGLQKIYPQNFKKKENKKGSENKEIKEAKHTINTQWGKLHTIE